MILLKRIILLFVLATLSGFCYAAPIAEGGAAGSDATEIAVGSSVLTGTAVATALAGVLILSMGSNGSNTSTNTSTTTSTAL